MLKYAIENNSGNSIDGGIWSDHQEVHIAKNQTLFLDIPAQEVASVHRDSSNLEIEAISGEVIVLKDYFQDGGQLKFLFSSLNENEVNQILPRDDDVLAHEEWSHVIPIHHMVHEVHDNLTDESSLKHRITQILPGEMFLYEFKLGEEFSNDTQLDIYLDNYFTDEDSWLHVSELAPKQFGIWGYVPEETGVEHYEIDIETSTGGVKHVLEKVDLELNHHALPRTEFSLTDSAMSNSLANSVGDLNGADLANIAIPAAAALLAFQVITSQSGTAITYSHNNYLPYEPVEGTDFESFLGGEINLELNEIEFESQAAPVNALEEFLHPGRLPIESQAPQLLVTSEFIPIETIETVTVPIEEVPEELPPLQPEQITFFTVDDDIYDMNLFIDEENQTQYFGADLYNAHEGNDIVLLPKDDVYAEAWNYDYTQVFNGGLGNDTILGFNLSDTINGGDGKDTLYGGENSDVLYGGNGNDYIDGGGTYEYPYYTESDSSDILYGGNGNDIIYGGESGDDIIYGGLGNDTIDGQTGADVMFGDGGNDYFYNVLNNDYVYGGSGFDVIHQYLSGDINLYLDTDQYYGIEIFDFNNGVSNNIYLTNEAINALTSSSGFEGTNLYFVLDEGDQLFIQGDIEGDYLYPEVSGQTADPSGLTGYSFTDIRVEQFGYGSYDAYGTQWSDAVYISNNIDPPVNAVFTWDSGF